jgi:hypothetical protein
MKQLSSIVTLLLLSGCAMNAVMIESPNSAYGPSEGKRIGQIVYHAFSTESQEDAYKQMYNACNGKYKILDREIKEKNEETTYEAQTRKDSRDNQQVHAKQSTRSAEYVYVTFECIL